MDKTPSDDNPKDGGMSAASSQDPQSNPSSSSFTTDTDPASGRILLPPLPAFCPPPLHTMVIQFMSYPPPNFNGLPVTQPQSNQIYYVKPIDYSPYSYMMPPLQPPNNYGWNIQPPPLVFPHIQNQPKMAEENSGPATNPVAQDINYTRPRSPNSTSSTESRSKKERTKPSVIPTTKFINETFDFNRKKRTRKKSKAEKLPDPQLTESVKELLKQYELNQKSLAVDVGSSETMVSQWINGTAKATGWADFEVKIRSWLNQEHKKPEKGPAFDFIDESTKLKSKFLRKSNK